MEMSKYYKITCPNGKIDNAVSLATLLARYIVKIENVLDYFNEIYGSVTTPCGQVYMGALMNSYLDEDEKYDFIQDYAIELADALLSDEWEINDEGNSFIEYGCYLIEEIENDWLSKSNSIANRMEGEY